MAQFRLAGPAKADLVHVLATSAARWGPDARRRHAALLSAAMREVAADPSGPLTRDRPELLPGLRSFHIRHVRAQDTNMKVRQPTHIIYYRVVDRETIEVLRVLHDRMEPSRHVGRAP
jgi:toxin ParE1/3/4